MSHIFITITFQLWLNMLYVEFGLVSKFCRLNANVQLGGTESTDVFLFQVLISITWDLILIWSESLSDVARVSLISRFGNGEC